MDNERFEPVYALDPSRPGAHRIVNLPEPGGAESVPTPEAGGVVAWAIDAFAALNMTWREAPAKGLKRVIGTTADQQALLDVTIRGRSIVGASAVVPVRPEYTPMLVFLLAVLVEQATREEADAWLARALDKLRRDKPTVTTQPWHRWRVTLTTTTLGLLTMKVR